MHRLEQTLAYIYFNCKKTMKLFPPCLVDFEVVHPMCLLQMFCPQLLFYPHSLMWLVLGQQPWVIRVNSRGLRTLRVQGTDTKVVFTTSVSLETSYFEAQGS